MIELIFILQISDLLTNKKYYITVWASTGAGSGPPTSHTSFTIPSANQAGSVLHPSTPPPDVQFPARPDQFLGNLFLSSVVI